MREFGGPEVLVAGEAPEPVAGPGQVVIQVAYAGITFVETMIRATGFGEPKLPMILGNGVGGLVSAVGQDVDPGLTGKRVISSTGGSGGYAERVAVEAAQLIEVPPSLELDAAVALLADGRTALLLIEAVGLREGERVLIEAAAGGVGSLLVQIARSAGATVIAAAGGERKTHLAHELGAELTVDYRDPDWADQVRTAFDGVDVVFDGVGGTIARRAFELLAPGGRLISYGLASGAWADISPDEAATRGVSLLTLPRPTPEASRAATERALAEAAAGRLRPVIGQRFPLERAADAHAAIESRATVGKTLLAVA